MWHSDALHTAEIQTLSWLRQLHARGGQDEETNNTESSKNPLTSLRFWVPIFDGLVSLGQLRRDLRQREPWQSALPSADFWCTRLLGFVAEIFNISKQPARTLHFPHQLVSPSTGHTCRTRVLTFEYI